jgi:hypothetical protein
MLLVLWPKYEIQLKISSGARERIAPEFNTATSDPKPLLWRVQIHGAAVLGLRRIESHLRISVLRTASNA